MSSGWHGNSIQSNSMASRGGQTERDLEAVVYQPLEGGQSANHDDPDRQAVPEAFEADVAVDPAHCFAGAFARCGFGGLVNDFSVYLIFSLSFLKRMGKECGREVCSPCLSAFNLLTITSAG